jgi:6-phosphogluconolactonase
MIKRKIFPGPMNLLHRFLNPSVLISALSLATTMSASSQLIYVGTYTNKGVDSRGIYAVRLDTDTGRLSEPGLAAEAANPTFLALHPNGRMLYALSETNAVQGKPGGGARSFQIEPATGRLTPLDLQSTGGFAGAHLGLDPAARTLVLASYSGGQVTSFSLSPEGRIGPAVSTQLLTGPLGPSQPRQDKPHPHSVTFSPDNRFVYVCDLGLDRIFRYQLKDSALVPAGTFASAPGAGPRHSKFSPEGKFFYVINELDGTIATYACDAATGDLTVRQVISTLPDGFTGSSTCAEIRLHPNGRFVYGSNRGHDSLAVFARNQADGTLTRLEIVPSGGRHPRNFALSPDGRWLVCANRDSNNLVVFKVDPDTGRLTATGHAATVPQAVCVLFVPTGS